MMKSHCCFFIGKTVTIDRLVKICGILGLNI